MFKIIILKSYKSTDSLVTPNTQSLSYKGDYFSISIMEQVPEQIGVALGRWRNKSLNVLQIPSAVLANRFGPKRVIMALMMLSTSSNLAQHPFALLLGRELAHWSFIILRFLNGLGLAAFFPVYGTILIGNWAAPLELSRMYGTALAGANVGTPLLNCHIYSYSSHQSDFLLIHY